MKNAQHALELQSDLDSMVQWSVENQLPFNYAKYEKITLTRKTRNIIHANYSMGPSTLRNVDSVRD